MSMRTYPSVPNSGLRGSKSLNPEAAPFAPLHHQTTNGYLTTTTTTTTTTIPQKQYTCLPRQIYHRHHYNPPVAQLTLLPAPALALRSSSDSCGYQLVYSDIVCYNMQDQPQVLIDQGGSAASCKLSGGFRTPIAGADAGGGAKDEKREEGFDHAVREKVGEGGGKARRVKVSTKRCGGRNGIRRQAERYGGGGGSVSAALWRPKWCEKKAGGGEGALEGFDDDGDDEDHQLFFRGKTTVMIKNIPNRLKRGDLVELLDKHCQEENQKGRRQSGQVPSAYDFVYLPFDFRTGSNLGYAFVNFTSDAGALRICNFLHRHKWEVHNTKKVCKVTCARIQGVEALKGHFQNSNFPCDKEEFLPVAYSPARDGLSNTSTAATASTENATIIGRCVGSLRRSSLVNSLRH